MIEIPLQTGYCSFDIVFYPAGPHSVFGIEFGATGVESPAFGFTGVNGRLSDDLGIFFDTYTNKPKKINVKYIGQNGTPSATIVKTSNGQYFTNRQRSSLSNERLRSEGVVSNYVFTSSDSSTVSVQAYGEDTRKDDYTVYYLTRGSSNDASIYEFLYRNFASTEVNFASGYETGYDITGVDFDCLVLGADIVGNDFAYSSEVMNLSVPIMVMNPSTAVGLGLIAEYNEYEIGVSVAYGVNTDNHYSSEPPRIFKDSAILYPYTGNKYNSFAEEYVHINSDALSENKRGRRELVGEGDCSIITSFTGGEERMFGVCADKRVVVNLSTGLTFTGLADDGKTILLNSLAWLIKE